MRYPKYKYHPTKEAVLVHSPEQEEGLPSTWVDSPAHYGVETCPGEAPDAAIVKQIKPAKGKDKGRE